MTFLYISGSTILLLTSIIFITTLSIFGGDFGDFENKQAFLKNSIISLISKSNISIAKPGFFLVFFIFLVCH